MDRTLRIGADSFDEREPLACRDYESVQMFGLCFDPLPRFLLDHKTAPAGRGMVHRFRVDTSRRWSDGSPILAEEIAGGLRSALTARGALRTFFFESLTDVTLQGDRLSLVFGTPNHVALDALALPAFTPRRGALTHRHVLADCRPHRLVFQRSKGVEPDPHYDRIEILRVRDPLENYQLYRMGVLHTTCDTAFPYDLLPYIQTPLTVHDTGLYMVIRYGGRLDQDARLRAEVHEAMRQFVLPYLLRTFQARTVGIRLVELSSELLQVNALDPIPSRTAELPSQARGLTLVYDDYFPNTLVAIQLQRHLACVDLDVTVQRTRDFYANDHAFDLKLEILSAAANSAPLRYAMLFQKLDLIRRDNEVARAYLRGFLELAALKTEEERSSVYADLDGLLDARAAYQPLCFLPSISCGRHNPLVETLSRRRLIYDSGIGG
jgi:hypothetical protein